MMDDEIVPQRHSVFAQIMHFIPLLDLFPAIEGSSLEGAGRRCLLLRNGGQLKDSQVAVSLLCDYNKSHYFIKT